MKQLILHIFAMMLWCPPLFLHAQSYHGIVQGTVTDSTRGRPMKNVNVWVPDTDIGTYTQNDGEYELSLPPGQYTIHFSHIGYTESELTVSLSSSAVLTRNVILRINPLHSEDVVIEQQVLESSFQPNIRVDVETARTLPALAEPDVFQSLSSYTGIIQTNDLSGNLFVRGGAPDQNQILVDGVEMYNPFHFYGMFSAINIWALSSFEVYSAQFPPRYNGKLSSVISLNTITPPETTTTVINSSLISSSITHTRSQNNHSILLSGRRSYLDYLSSLADYPIPYNFHDVLGKYTYRINKNMYIELFGLRSLDQFSPQNSFFHSRIDSTNDLNNSWGNNVWSAQLKRKIDNTYTVLRFYQSQNFLQMSDPGMYDVENLIDNMSLEGHFRQQFATNTVYTGFFLRNISVDYRWTGDETLESVFYDGVPGLFDYQQSSFHYGLYLENEVKLPLDYTFAAGVNFYSWYDTDYFSPRLNLRKTLQDHSEIHLTYGKYLQHLSHGAVPREGSIMAPLFMHEKPSISHTFLLTYLKSLNKYLRTKGVLYYRNYHNLVEIQTNATYPSFRFNDGYTLGIDLELQRMVSKIQYRINTSVQKNINYDNGDTYPPAWDTPFSVNGVISYRFLPKWIVSIQSAFRSGFPYTPVTGKYLSLIDPRDSEDLMNMKIQFINGERHSAQLSDYFRFDLSLRRKIRVSNIHGEIYLQVLNLFNRGNILRYNWSEHFAQENIGTANVYTGATTSLPMFPTIGLTLHL